MPRHDVAPALARALENTSWLRPEHRVGDPTAYMRHVLYVDPDGDFVMTAITWLPGQVSPIHGHQVWCAFGVAEGDLDCSAIHRVSNRSRGTIVSLHLYGVSAERLTTGINRIYPNRIYPG